MKMRNIYLFFALLLVPAFLSCNKWLDVMPDNRAEVDTVEKVAKLLVSAYSDSDYIITAEMAADNLDDMGASNPYSSRFYEQMFYSWCDVTEADNDDPKNLWQGYYGAITNANQALAAIEELGNTEELAPYRGEALLCRAYAHFILVNMFCKAYNPATADTDLGIPYMDKPETELDPKYERGTVAEVYSNIRKDIEEGLPLINDGVYSIPKFHFNEKAANTFASRFYLFTGEWDEAIRCANVALGSSPRELLRDYVTLASYPKDLTVVPVQYSSSNMKNNFLLQASYSYTGYFYSNYFFHGRFSQNNFLVQTEIMNCAPWGTFTPSASSYTYGNMYKLTPYVYIGTNFDKTILPKYNPRLMEYTDPVAGVGYFRTLSMPLIAEEALLNRAEAYIMKEDYTKALEDINLWTNNTLNPARCTPNLTEESIQAWADSYEYYTATAPTPKKRLSPMLVTLEEGSKKEAFTHCILYIRRVEFMQCGMRWFDVKRYGIEVYRRTISTSFAVSNVADCLTVDDERRALQLPKDVITAGLTPNPR
ncbi:MAG: RagB/SusD family nutrient uptake outer membrane protein [Bacteroidales bacterium]|nr:RagB/SusD family nutrient uptake outer membrane protein [Bacteroidales bacterium]